MKAWWRRWREGPLAVRLLSRMGIAARQYWLLVDLFEELTERRDLYSQAGVSGIGWRAAAMLYFVVFTLVGLAAGMAEPPTGAYLLAFLGITVAVLSMMLLPEAGNSLVNPSEALLLAHLPVRGATYTAAKLTHLVKVVGYLVPAINLGPALMGWKTRQSFAAYPFAHLAAAFLAGVVVALGCCAAYGWLLRLVPAGRLRSAGQTLEMAPWVFLAVMQSGGKQLKSALAALSVPGPAFWWPMGAGAVAFLIFGLRSLSLDYLVRVTSIAHGRGSRPAQRRRRWAARWLSSAPVRAGYYYLGALFWRDAAFRRQALVCLTPLLINAAAIFQGLGANPFTGEFSAMHVFPHVLGVMSLLLAPLLAGGSHPQAAWLFQLAHSERLNGFARGSAWALGSRLAGLPHLLLAAPLVWKWGLRDGVLFLLFSAAVTLAYLAVALRLVEGIPFARKLEREQSAVMLPMLLAAGAIIAAAVALQHFLLFSSRYAVAAGAALLGLPALWGLRAAVRVWAEAMRFQVSALGEEGGSLYREVNL
jgi:hypothetical protein